MKRIVSILLGITVFVLFSVNAYAETTDEVLDEMSQEIQDGVSNSIMDELEEDGIDISSPESVGNVEASDIFDKIINALSANVSLAVKIVAKITALVIICTTVRNYIPDSCCSSESFSFISVACCSSIIMTTLHDCMDLSLNALNSINTFMISYIPVFTSIAVTSGSVTAATSYNVIMFSVCEIVTVVANNFIIPVLGVVLSLSIAGSINPDFSFVRISSGLKKIVLWVLGVSMTVVVAVLAIQSVIGASADTVATKTAKYAVSSFVPFVGGAVSEAFLTVKSSMGIIRSGIGGIGIIIVLFIVIPPVAAIAMVRLAVMICEFFADILDEKPIVTLMSSVSSMLSICLSTVICVGLMFILSTAILLLMGMNTV